MNSIDKLNGELFRDIALYGSATFLENLVPQSKLKSYGRYNGKNSKRFLLMKLVAEVQKFGFALDRWIEVIGNIKTENNNINLLRFNSLIDEQSIWQRKLLEGFILLLNFTRTNKIHYYYHYLLLNELEKCHYLAIDQSEYFGSNNLLNKNKCDRLQSRISIVETRINDNTGLWYINQH